jgi:ribosomal protein S18 acetylase RimI-like enzyme
MVAHVLDVMKQRGFRSVHILVNRDNIKAIRSYAHIGFRQAGECFMYDQHFLCYEKALTAPAPGAKQ